MVAQHWATLDQITIAPRCTCGWLAVALEPSPSLGMFEDTSLCSVFDGAGPGEELS